MPYKDHILEPEELCDELEAENARLRQELAEARAENERLQGRNLELRKAVTRAMTMLHTDAEKAGFGDYLYDTLASTGGKA